MLDRDEPNTSVPTRAAARLVRRALLEPDEWREIVELVDRAEQHVEEAERAAAKERARVAFLRSLLREAQR